MKWMTIAVVVWKPLCYKKFFTTSLIFLRQTGHLFLFSFSLSAHSMQHTWWPVLPCTKLALRGCVKQITHKSREKVASGPFVSDFLSTTCFESDKLNSSLAESLFSCLSFVADEEALKIQEALVSDEGLTGCNDDGDDNGVLSILGDTGRETLFCRDGKTGIVLVAVVTIGPGSEDNLKQSEIEKKIRAASNAKTPWERKLLKATDRSLRGHVLMGNECYTINIDVGDTFCFIIGEDI